MYKRDEDKREQERQIARQEAEYNYKNSLSIAQSKRNRVNNSGQLRAFIVTRNEDAYLHSFVLRSMNSGITLGGSKVVDSNIRTELNGRNHGERRIRISCNEGRNMGIFDGSLTYSDIPVTAKMGRWACGKYGFYHP